VKVAPSIIAADFSHYQEELQRIKDAGADCVHLDVMDGVFVPNLTFGPMIVEAIDKVTDMTLWSHLMIMQPEKYLKEYIAAGSDWISFHVEATERVDQCLAYCKQHGVQTGLSINPATPLEQVKHYLPHVDILLIMTVTPGFYGQKFMDDVVPKIQETKQYMIEHGIACSIAVDGGVNRENACTLKKAGTEIVVAGASVFRSHDYAQAIQELRCSKV
jgi:ribulose-phosphate 3-epimerase